MHKLVQLILVPLLAIVCICQADILGVEGYVQLSGSDADAPAFQYDSLGIIVTTVDKQQQTEEKCMPNGYFFVPLTGQGTYIARAASQGQWRLEPETVQFSCSEHKCNDGKDIIFKIKGLAIETQIVSQEVSGSCKQPGEGPAGVAVTLRGAGGKEVASSVSGAGGKVHISGLLPQQYTLAINEDKAQYSIDTSQAQVNAEWGGVEYKGQLKVAGYTLSGRVTAGTRGLPGATVYLLTNFLQPTQNRPESTQLPPHTGYVVQSSKTNQQGGFEFHRLPCGEYNLTAVFGEGDASYYAFSPIVQQVSVGHSHLAMETPFIVNGVSISGRVTDESRNGLRGVVVQLIQANGSPVATADSDERGEYAMRAVPLGTYSVRASAPMMTFDGVEQFVVGLDNSVVGDIRLREVQVSGSVQMNEPKQTKNAVPVVQVTVARDGSDSQQELETDQQGVFRTMLAPGTYKLAAHAAPGSQQAPVRFYPTAHTFKVTNTPLDNIKFTQRRMALAGSVQCPTSCPKTLAVSVQGDEVRVVAELDWANASVSGGDAGGTDGSFEVVPFRVHDLMSGEYRVAATAEGACFGLRGSGAGVGAGETSAVVSVAIVDADVEVPVITQTGSQLVVSTPHDATLIIGAANPSDSFYVRHEASEQLSVLCVPAEVPIAVAAYSDCYALQEATGKLPKYQTDSDSSQQYAALSGGCVVTAPTRVDMAMVSWKLTGSVSVAAHPDGQTLDELPLTIAYQNEGNAGQVETRNGLRAKKGTPVEGGGQSRSEYNFVADVYKGWVPTWRVALDSVSCGGEVSVRYSRSVRGCQQHGRVACEPSHAIEVAIQPATEGLNVTIINNMDRSQSNTCLTSSTGTCRFAGLTGTSNYDIQVIRDGWVVSQVDDVTSVKVEKLRAVSYSVKQLGSISVQVKLPVSPTPPILLSISGPAQYRTNTHTDQSGTANIKGLSPGEFYIRASDKEYSFTPTTASVSVEDGGQQHVVFDAVRVRFAVTGTVRYLNGRPAKGVAVEVSGGSGVREVGVSGEDGVYRVRGVPAGGVYSARVLKDGRAMGGVNTMCVSHWQPQGVSVSIAGVEEAKDVDGVDFVVVGGSMCDARGTVAGVVHVNSSSVFNIPSAGFGDSVQLFVSVHKRGSGGQGAGGVLISEREVDAVGAFEVQKLPPGAYDVSARIVQRATARTVKCVSSSVHVVVESGVRSVIGVVDMVCDGGGGGAGVSDLGDAPGSTLILLATLCGGVWWVYGRKGLGGAGGREQKGGKKRVKG